MGRSGRASALWTAVGAVVVLVGALVWADVPLVTSLVLVGVVAVQAAGGVLAVRMLGPARLDAFGLIGLGLAIGTAMAVLSGIAFGLVGFRMWGWAVPAAAFAIAAVIRRGRLTRHPVDPVSRGAVVALLVSSLGALASFAIAISSYPLEWTGTWSRYHPDMFFFEALGESAARFGSPAELLMPGADIRYHWFVYAWNGQVSQVAGAAPFASLTRLVLLVAMLAAVLIAISWASRASRMRWVPLLAALLLVVGGNLGTVYGGVFNVDSPSQSFTTIWLLALTYLVVLMVEPATDALTDGWTRGRMIGAQVGVAILVVCLVGGKVSMALVTIPALVLLALVGVLRREQWARIAVVAAGVAVVAALVTFVVVLRGASDSGGLTLFSMIDRSSSQQGLNPVEGLRGVVVGTAVLVLSVVVRWAGLGYLAGSRQARWQPVTVLGVGLALAGAGALVVFNGLNELWFAVGASAPLSVLTAVGVGEAVARIEPSARRLWRVVAVSAVAAAVVYAVVWKLWATGASGGNVWVSTLRWTGPVVGTGLAAVVGAAVAWACGGGRRPVRIVAGFVVVVVLATVPGRVLGVGTGQIGVQPGLRTELFSAAFSVDYPGRQTNESQEIPAGFVGAVDWLRDHAGPDDLVATNRTTGAIVPAFTGLPMYVSGVRYLAGYARPTQVPEAVTREAQSWSLIDEPSPVTLAQLCDAGVRWAFVDLAMTGQRDWSSAATVAFANDDAAVLDLTCD